MAVRKIIGWGVIIFGALILIASLFQSMITAIPLLLFSLVLLFFGYIIKGRGSEAVAKPSEKKKMSILKKIGIGAGIFFLVIIALGIIGSMISTPTKTSTLSEDEIKSTALKNITYDDLMRNVENYKGKVIYYRGEVIQVSQGIGDNYDLRIGVTPNEFGIYNDIIWVNYRGSRVLENDLVDLWGNVKGLKTYTAVLGNEVTVPEVDALILNVVIKAGNRTV